MLRVEAPLQSLMKEHEQHLPLPGLPAATIVWGPASSISILKNIF